MAKSSTCNISIRMDSNLKAAAEALYEELGITQDALDAVGEGDIEEGFLSKLPKELQAKEPSRLCLRQKGLQKILLSKVITM